MSKNYSIHALSDSNTPLRLPPTKPSSRESTSTSASPPKLGFLARQTSTLSTKIARAKAYDKPVTDPRTETSPYFLHQPTLYGHCPPYTLRHGGNKRAPVAALLHNSCGWRCWHIEFGECLKEEGVIDGRGVVNARFGTEKGRDGTLRGYEVRKRRWWGESGKEWFKEHKKLMESSASVEEKVEAEEMEKVKPEEVVKLRWVAPLSRAREYQFDWRGFKFAWKGTGQVHSRMKIWRPFMMFHHLKLVVIVPGKAMDGGKQTESSELVLAMYTSAVSKRKAGRLEVFQEAIEAFLSNNVLPNSKALHITEHLTEKPPMDQHPNLAEVTKTQQRLDDVVMATALSMVIGEFEKRQTIISIILAAADGAGN